ncbi:MAG: serine/threonine protein kinase, partial [Pirellulaceae bacterium]
QSPDEQRRGKQLSLTRNQPPAQIPGYTLQQFLGQGAYGEVWVGMDLKTGRQVAVKFFNHRRSVDWQLLSREVEKLRFLSANRYVVQLLDVGWEADPPYYVMEYIDNGSLEDHIRQQGALPVEEAVPIFEDIVAGVVHAHAKGVLHCDLKPANILLDEDGRPRLADFGQARLSNEQRPALGTLFFMAPEQADLEAVPDAQWDVYALGAMMYFMLTNKLPYRSGDAVRDLDSARDLVERLSVYRKSIEQSPPPVAHRRIKGVDRGLIEIIDRCLARDPSQRFSSAQSIWDALKSRQQQKAALPLKVLGFIGPLLLLAVAGLFTARSFNLATQKSENTVFQHVIRSNESEALTVSVLVANTLDRYYRAVETANDESLLKSVKSALQDPELKQLLTDLREAQTKLRDEKTNGDDFEKTRQEFVEHDARKPLQTTMENLITNPRKPAEVASWILLGPYGTQLAAAYDSAGTRPTIGRNYAYRTYFHGGIDDFKSGENPSPNQRIQKTHLSAPLRSTATNTWKIAVTTPVLDDDGSLLGVMGLTVEVGNIVRFPRQEQNDDDARYLMLVDGRPGEYEGLILQHRLLQKLRSETGTVPPRFADYRVPETFANGMFTDPIAADVLGEAYRKKWIAAKKNVVVEVAGLDATYNDTKLYVLVVEDYNESMKAIHELGSSLSREGLLALLNCICVVGVLWYFVSRRMVEKPTSRVLRQPSQNSTTSMQDMTTLVGQPPDARK